MPGFQPIFLGKDDLAGPIAISRDFYSDMHLCCMCALSIPDPADLKGDHDDVQAQLQAAFQVNGRGFDFGPFAVVVGAGEFTNRLHGESNLEDVPFRKQNKFAYQSEYRVCQTNAAGDEPIIVDVGDLSAFAVKTRSADLNSALKVTLRRPPACLPGRTG